MTKGTLKAFLWSVINNADDLSYKGLANIILIACGVIDVEGKLTPQFEESPYWTVKDGKIVPSEHIKLIGELMKTEDKVIRKGQ